MVIKKVKSNGEKEVVKKFKKVKRVVKVENGKHRLLLRQEVKPGSGLTAAENLLKIGLKEKLPKTYRAKVEKLLGASI